MALGFLSGLFGSKKGESSTSSPSTEKVDPTLAKDVNTGDFAADQNMAESGGKKTSSSRKPMNRIDGPITKSITGEDVVADDNTDASVAIGKQMELEAGNAIKYRTCSWQKVRIYPDVLI